MKGLVIATTPPPHYGMTGLGVQDLGVLGIFAGVGVLIYEGRRRAAAGGRELN